MIDIKINMTPFGQIAAIHIASDYTSGTLTKGNYKYKIIHKGRVYRKGNIKGFPRRKKNVIWLLKQVLEDALNE